MVPLGANFPAYSDGIPSKPYSITDHHYGKCITPHGLWTDGCTEAYFDNGATGVNLNLWTGWEREPLDLITQLTGLKAIHIFTASKEDISCLGDHAGTLEVMKIESLVSRRFDLSSFKRLKIFSCKDGSKYSNLELCTTLEDCFVYRGFKAPNLKLLKKLPLMRRFSATWGGIEEIGLDAPHPNMEELELNYCRKLSNISSLKMLPNLTSLYITSAKKIADITPITSLPKLNGLILAGCGTFDSIEPILQLRNLSYLSLEGSTTFKNTDIMRLLELPNLTRAIVEPKRCYGLDNIDNLQLELRKRRDKQKH